MNNKKYISIFELQFELLNKQEIFLYENCGLILKFFLTLHGCGFQIAILQTERYVVFKYLFHILTTAN